MFHKLEIEKIQKVFEKKEYKFFENGDFNVNLFGIRSNIKESGHFDDYIYLVYKKYDKWQIECFRGTTDPGKYWMKTPMNKKGCAILVPGQYPGMFKTGVYKKYQALKQDKPCRVYRDGNKDIIMDLIPESIQEGDFGIHMHKKGDYYSENNKSSAGCQVSFSWAHLKRIILICKKSAALFGNSFTYTLFNSEDFFNEI